MREWYCNFPNSCSGEINVSPAKRSIYIVWACMFSQLRFAKAI